MKVRLMNPYHEEIEETIKNYDKRIGEITYIEEQYCPYFKLRYIK